MSSRQVDQQVGAMPHAIASQIDPALTRRERRKIEMRERILEAAVALFDEHGFAATKVSEICEQADIAHKTFFNHFPSKQDLLSEIARERLNSVHGHPIADDVEVEWIERSKVRAARVNTPESKASTRVLLLCHGGAYIAAGGDGYLFYAAMLSRSCRCEVVLVDYRLAPDHPHPAALEDCANAYEGLLAEGVEPDRVAFIGDSCGGALVLTSLLLLRDRGVAQPAAAVALGGWFDLEANADSARNPLGSDPFANRDFLRARGRDYVGPDGDLRDPLVSPIHAKFHDLPPLLLQVGQIDLTRGDAERFGASAAKAGVHVQVEVVPGMVHGFQGLASAGVPESQHALARVASFLELYCPDSQDTL
jgi:monoterpene epsilon-lactone hydrolase